ncbi:MAG: hypothetical protein M1830_002672 [Pleopsidium flavum]|nr:MAG: hypothetical protein M1830_002672 [Pleopsidium flavum]
MTQLWGQPEPGKKMNELMTDLGFRSDSQMRQKFYDDLRVFHQDPLHTDRRDLSTLVDNQLVNQEQVNFLRDFGHRYFGPENRSHLTRDARVYADEATDDQLKEAFPTVRSALLHLSQNRRRDLRRKEKRASITLVRPTTYKLPRKAALVIPNCTSDLYTTSMFTSTDTSDNEYRVPKTRKKARPFVIKDKAGHAFRKGTKLIAWYKEADLNRPEGWYAHHQVDGAEILLPAVFRNGHNDWTLEHPDGSITRFKRGTASISGKVYVHIPAQSDGGSRHTAQENAKPIVEEGRVATKPQSASGITAYDRKRRSSVSLHRASSESSSRGPAPLGPQFSGVARDCNSSAASKVHVSENGRSWPIGFERPKQNTRKSVEQPEAHTSNWRANRVPYETAIEHGHSSDKDEQTSPSTMVTNQRSIVEPRDHPSSASYWNHVQAQMEIPTFPSSLRTLSDKNSDEAPTPVWPARSNPANNRNTEQLLRTKPISEDGGANNKDYSITTARNTTSDDSSTLPTTSGKRRHQGHSDGSGLPAARSKDQLVNQGIRLTEESSHAVPSQSKKVCVDFAPEIFGKREAGRTPSGEFPFEVQLCVPNARGAYKKWQHGKLNSHTVQTLFERVADSCLVTSHLKAINFTLPDTSSEFERAVQEYDEDMLQYVKVRIGKILAKGKYTGIFRINMDPVVSEDEGDIVTDF